MQKVVKVSIANIAFTLEQDAHELMRDYLERLQIHYESSPNCGEILSEIESRIAELLSERGYRDKVVPPETVQEIIDILGRPEDFDSEAESGDQPRNRKRVFRDPDNKILGGVCGGLGAYFSVDPLIFRIAFAVWVFFFFWLEVFADWGWGMSVLGMFAYVILWISMPEARTVEQRYNMKGGSVSLKNIQKTVEKEAKDVSRKVSRGVKEGVRSTGGFWKALGRCFGIIFGALFFLIGMAGCAASLLAVFGIGIWTARIRNIVVPLSDYRRPRMGIRTDIRPYLHHRHSAVHRSAVRRHTYTLQAKVSEMETRTHHLHCMGSVTVRSYRGFRRQPVDRQEHGLLYP